MRQAGEEYLASYDGFSSIEGSAESTTLDDPASTLSPPASVSLVRSTGDAPRIMGRILKARWLGGHRME